MVTHAKKNFERTSCVMRSVSARENWELHNLSEADFGNQAGQSSGSEKDDLIATVDPEEESEVYTETGKHEADCAVTFCEAQEGGGGAVPIVEEEVVEVVSVA
ncbi:hypothetical protein Pelo_11209 [Pelomyxa schiedti]|nr:hypothetical protein Pelo_11209 [Pelomyxa schiedti]